jgi:arginyl-tRNA synthetase
MKEQIKELIFEALDQLGIKLGEEVYTKITVDYPDFKFGHYSSNAAMIVAKVLDKNPKDLAQDILGHIHSLAFEQVSVAGPGFINFQLKSDFLISKLAKLAKEGVAQPSKVAKQKILVEYFQPNIAKPMHVGLLRTTIIGDCLKRMFLFLGFDTESDTHMGDWGTQFGLLLLAYKKSGNYEIVSKDPINELNKLYVQINIDCEATPSLKEEGKQEFVKLEQGDEENRKIWKMFVDWSMEKFLRINALMDVLPFDHHWPESFYEDKMPEVLKKLKTAGLLVESQGAQIVDLQADGLGVAIMVKSDGGTTYLLRDMATFIYRKQQGFTKQLYVVDNRQSHSFNQLFAILAKLKEMDKRGIDGEHVNYGFISFKGEALSTRKGNMVLVEDVISEAQNRVEKIIQEKNPNLAGKTEVVSAISKAALKYFDLSHNRHSDIEFSWDEVLDFEGNSGPYLQYTYARLASILRKLDLPATPYTLYPIRYSDTEQRIMFLLSIFSDKVRESLNEFLPNIFTNYLYELCSLLNKFYHESPVTQEADEDKKLFRISLIKASKNVLSKGFDLLGIKAVEEM